MLGNFFYNETIRKSVIAFGTLFNNIRIKKFASDGKSISQIKIPIAYGPMQRFLARIEQQQNFDDNVALTLPRLSFEMTSFTYDTTRKASPITKFTMKSPNSKTKVKKMYLPVPYDIGFRLSFATKLQDDSLQIIEQILPFFQPDYTLTIKDMTEMGIKRDVPIVLNSVAYEDNYQGEFTERRAIIYTLSFTTKFYLYGPITSQNIIKTVQVDQYTDLPDASPKREQRYTVTPSPATSDADDDFGFNETTSFFEDAKDFNPKTGNDDADNSTSGVGT